MKKQSQIRLLAVDLDGTMLSADSQLTPETIEAVGRCAQSGIAVIVVTARPPRSARVHYDALGIDTPSIHYNGALIYDYRAESVRHHYPIPPETARELCTLCIDTDPQAVVSLEVCDRWYINYWPESFQTQTSRAGFKPHYIGELSEFLEHPVTKMLVSFPTVGSAAGTERVVQCMGSKLSLTKSEEGGVLQIMNAGVTKASALRVIMKEFGVEPDQAAAMGDAPNDIPMLEIVGLPIAMGNAYAETKAAARYVTTSNAENGAARAIDMILEGKLGAQAEDGRV